ncbi:DNA-binding response regulator [Motiliproteus coralliicola]|uniref:DNA-binding response regulator n=1 Tax=Motiliproteus coralliicola TaxID=2283196 RepID=A0A369WFF8_9GAMM|nr:response regulator transcription factor [Motiliproteus coralliicola]RDE18205.1 DNA-binding response regulator [Motiliproteus coralliicola]
MEKILLVDDDLELCQMLAEFMELEGFSVDQVHDGEQALQQAARQQYAVIILDVMMPTLNGFDTLKQLRGGSGDEARTPVLMMSARGEEVDRIVGLEIGADDYLPKPCSPRELVARIRAIIRRVALENGGSSNNDDNLLSYAGLKLNRQDFSASANDHPLALTQTEFRILECLLDHADRLVTKQNLTRYALNRNLGPYDRSIDMHLSNLRKKLSQTEGCHIQIQTVRGSGYRLFDRPRDA